MIPDLVSTIIPVYNRAAMVTDAIDSVMAQTHASIEVIVVDDGSTDDTAAALLGAQARYGEEKIRLLHIPNSGPGIAREHGRAAARGEFIQYLDSDDLLLPHKFEKQVAVMRTGDYDIVYGMSHHAGVGQVPEPIPFKRTGEKFESMLPATLLSRWWTTTTPLYRRQFSNRLGAWLPTINEEDWEYDMRAARLGAKLGYCPEFVSIQRWHSEPRLIRDGDTDPLKLRHKSLAREKILEHAAAAGVPFDSAEMRHFARALFHLSRQCAAAGAIPEARQLIELAKSAATKGAGGKNQLALYSTLSSIVGWRRMGRISSWLDEHVR